MDDLFIVAVFALTGVPFLAIYATWFFGLRPFVAKHGRARITVVSWSFSMLADWTVAREIEKVTGKRTWSTRLFFGLWVYVIVLGGGCYALAYCFG